MEEAPALADTLLQQVNMISPLCRFWKIVIANNVPAHQPEPWAETGILDNTQRIEVEDLLAKHYNARLQNGQLPAYDIRVDLFDSNGGLPMWDLTRVPARQISRNTRIHVKLETEDQVWCGPDPSLACKALELFTKKTSISEAQLRAEFKAFVDAQFEAFKVNPEEALADGLQTLCATPGDAASNGWMSVHLSEMVKGGYSQQVERHNDKLLYRNTAAHKSAEWLLCTKKGSWAFCDSESKEGNTDGEVWGESVEAVEVSPISCPRWRISQDWLTA